MLFRSMRCLTSRQTKSRSHSEAAVNLERTAQPKPKRGTALLKKRERRRELVAHEQKEMRAAKRRDGGKCRFPRCPHKDLPVDAAHLRSQHRAIGGNPAGDRTSRAAVISLCRWHHGEYDTALIKIEFLTPDQQFDGPCAYFVRHQETGEWLHIGSDRRPE